MKYVRLFFENKIVSNILIALVSIWPVFLSWVTLIWLIENVKAVEVFFDYFEKIIYFFASTIIGLPISFVIIAVVMVGWALLPIWVMLAVDKLQKHLRSKRNSFPN